MLWMGSSLAEAVPNRHLVNQYTENSWDLRYLKHRDRGGIGILANHTGGRVLSAHATLLRSKGPL